MDFKETFPKAAVNQSLTEPIEQRFTIGDATICIVTFISCYGKVPYAGIVIEQGEFQNGYFQARGYVGNSLEGSKINPINAYKGVYDLTLDGKIVASFSHTPGRGWSKQ